MLTLYSDPIATVCRPVLLLIEEAGIEVQCAPINLFGDENRADAFTAMNPNQTVPVLDHDGLVLTESSTILRYLANMANAASYPADIKTRAQIDNWLDWFATLFRQDYNYGLVYSVVLPGYCLSPAAERERRAWHQERANKRLAVLEAALKAGPFLFGDEPTIADFLGITSVTIGELIDLDLSAWPNIQRWIAAMKARPSWNATHAAFYGWKSAIEAESRGAA